MSTIAQNLAAGTRLDHYVIEKTLSAGGFSIVYLADDLSTGAKVVIKEYLPSKWARRDTDCTIIALNDKYAGNLYEGRQLFLLEVSTLKKLRHPCIVSITHSFEANGTVYIVMEYKPGQNLQHYIHEHQGGLSETFLRTVFPPLLDGLRLVHKIGLLHLDIKPGNIHLQPGGDPILLDFGAALRLNMSRTMQPRPVVTAGFSPIEQYNPKGYCGPWTDIYALGATMRACIEGTSPPPATERIENDKLRPAVSAFKRKYSKTLLQAIDWAMELDPTLRPQNIDEFMQAFNKADTKDSSTTVFRRWVDHLPWVNRG